MRERILSLLLAACLLLSMSVPALADGSDGTVPAPDGTPAPEATEQPLPPADGTEEPAPAPEATEQPLPPADGTEEPAPAPEVTEEPLPPADGTEEPAPAPETTEEPLHPVGEDPAAAGAEGAAPGETTEPAAAAEEEPESALDGDGGRELVDQFQYTYINPIYAGIITEADLADIPQTASAADAPQATAASIEEAGLFLREIMKNRVNSFMIAVSMDKLPEKSDLETIFSIAVRHTGVPTEGDYLWFQYGVYSVSTKAYSTWTGYVAELTYSIKYFNVTDEMEQQLGAEVTKVLQQMDLTDKDDYTKVKTIYDYICQHVTYDYSHLTDDSYGLDHSAYAAMIHGTSVCQGYATLLYRMLLEAGVENRIISGLGNSESHSWNIIQLNGKYYLADATWDSSRGSNHVYFLRCAANFPDHTNDEKYCTAEWIASHPMSETDYIPGMDTPPAPSTPVPSTPTPAPETLYPVPGCDLKYSISIKNKTLTISGQGDMPDFTPIDTPAWSSLRTLFDKVVIEDGVTGIGAFAFHNFENVKSVTFPSSLKEIRQGAFNNCYGLQTTELPEGLLSIGSMAFSCGLVSVTIPRSVQQVDAGAFYCEDLERVTVLNPLCRIDLGPDTLGQSGVTTIYGYTNSAAEEYAAKNNYSFISQGCLGDADGNGTFEEGDLDSLFLYVRQTSGTDDAALDLSGDYTVDLKDVTKLYQYLAGRTSLY